MYFDGLPASKYPQGEEGFEQTFFEFLIADYLLDNKSYDEILQHPGITAVCSNITDRQIYIQRFASQEWERVCGGGSHFEPK
jgi:hypothetical protein